METGRENGPMEYHYAQTSGPDHGNGASTVRFHLQRRKVHSLVTMGLGLALVPYLLLGCGAECFAAASAPKVTAAPTAKLLFQSNFGPGVSLSNPYGFYASAKGGGGDGKISPARTAKPALPGRLQR